MPLPPWQEHCRQRSGQLSEICMASCGASRLHCSTLTGVACLRQGIVKVGCTAQSKRNGSTKIRSRCRYLTLQYRMHILTRYVSRQTLPRKGIGGPVLQHGSYLAKGSDGRDHHMAEYLQRHKYLIRRNIRILERERERVWRHPDRLLPTRRHAKRRLRFSRESRNALVATRKKDA